MEDCKKDCDCDCLPYVQPPFVEWQMTELGKVLAGIEAHEAMGERKERHRMIAGAVHMALENGLDAGFRPVGLANGSVVNTDAYPIPSTAGGVVAYIVLPFRKSPIPEDAGYHEFEYREVAYFLDKDVTPWDGHDRATKLGRIRQFRTDFGAVR